MEKNETIRIKESAIIEAAAQSMDEFIYVFVNAIKNHIGGELTAETMAMLNPSQITLFGYFIMREELMDGGFVQLIHNGYGPFFFDNPFAKAMRLWGAKDFSKLIYKAKELYDKHKDEITKPCDEEEFMALFEQFPEFDNLDDAFIETEENLTALIAQYVDEHIELFAEVVKD